MLASESSPLDLVIVASGLLHDDETMPEKSLRDLSGEKFLKLFNVNTVTPAIVAKHFIPRLNTDTPAIFAALSARVGSISDNHLGGWYAYRASKAALNMVIKNLAIEAARRNKGSDHRRFTSGNGGQRSIKTVPGQCSRRQAVHSE